MFLILFVIFVTLVFTYINGFHDTANSIATVVSTKVLTPRQAILLAAVTNLIGAFFGTAVATTIASGLVEVQVATMPVLCCAMLAAIAWNLITWWSGLPSSSSHALVGGLCGAVLAASGNRLGVHHLVRSGQGALVAGQGCSLESHRADDHFASGWIHRRLCPHEPAVFSAAQLATRHRQPGLRQTPVVERGLHGFRPLHK